MTTASSDPLARKRPWCAHLTANTDPVRVSSAALLPALQALVASTRCSRQSRFAGLGRGNTLRSRSGLTCVLRHGAEKFVVGFIGLGGLIEYRKRGPYLDFAV
jgi:hypothetical protein